MFEIVFAVVSILVFIPVLILAACIPAMIVYMVKERLFVPLLVTSWLILSFVGMIMEGIQDSRDKAAQATTRPALVVPAESVTTK